MKKIITLIAVVLSSFTAFAQSSVFEKFESMDDVSSVVITKQAFSLMARFNNGSEEAKEYNNLVKNVNSLQVYTTENKAIASEMATIVKKHLKSATFTELMRVKDKDVNIKFYIRSGKDADHVKELLMFLNGASQHLKHNDINVKSEAVVFSITGDLNLNDLSKLMKKMNIDGAEHLNKSKK